VLSKSQIKLVKSLKHKKYRNNYKLFVLEGLKGILELKNSSFDIDKIILSKESYDKHKSELPVSDIIITSKNQINSLSTLKNNFSGLAILKMKNYNVNQLDFEDFVIGVDSLKDPGNLGTILRIADWYNIKSVICSNDTVDLYNSKVIQSSMGSFLRVNTAYTDLEIFFKKSKYIIIGTSLDGDNIKSLSKIKKGIILFGNESNGISKNLFKHINKWVSIKKYGKAESLNVAISSAVILDNLRNN
jgi:RNA methyltransferase, TrmH family|tara:strand:+ start:81532 stop:82266 length:735 start_codon:yes stop_codon:yes gene_type:complete